MAEPESPDPTPTPQTIVIERRERGGFVRRIVVPILFVFLLFLVLGNGLSRESAVPTRLVETYVAGEVSGSTVAIVEVTGLILQDEVDHIIRQVRQARDEERVKAIVLRVDSPGGETSAVDRIYRELVVVKEKGKPIVASIGGLAGSGGYYLASPSNRILAEPTSLTGGLAVAVEMPRADGTGSMLYGRGVPTERTGRWREAAESAYRRLLRVVAQGRALPLAEVESLADGRVYPTQEAIRVKLVDEVGYLDDAILEAQRQVKLESARVIRYARPTPLESLFGLAPSVRPAPNEAEGWLRSQTPRVLYLAR